MNWNPTNWLATFLASRSSPASSSSFDKPAVVMLHGIFDSGSKMAWLAARISQRGYETFCPSLKPSDGTCSLEKLSAQLDNKIHERFSSDRKLHIVGFSMGGLIVRHWLAKFAWLPRVVSFSTLSTPHQGTFTAYFHCGQGACDMRPRSAFLRALDAADNHLQHLQALSLYTPLDLIIIPSRSSRWKAGRFEVLWLWAHPLMVFSHRVAARLLREFKEREKTSVLS